MYDTAVGTVEYSEIVLSMRVKKYEVLREFFNVFDNLCDVDAKEIISSNFYKIKKKMFITCKGNISGPMFI